MREARHERIRRKLSGTPERPRLAVFRSSNHIYAQVIDDVAGKTLAAASTRGKDLKGSLAGLKPVEAASKVGTRIAEVAKANGIAKVVFDRGGLPFKGRIKALAEAARSAGLEF